MTDNEIIKAWECCLKSEMDTCNECPYDKICEENPDTLTKDTVDLINRQKAEIERLTNKLEQREEMIANLGVELTTMRGAANSHKMHYDKSQVENKRLWEERNRIYENLQETNSELEEYRKAYVKAKSEAIKEFAERLKATDTSDLVGEQYINGEIYGYFYNNAFEIKIDNLVKEMVGE